MIDMIFFVSSIPTSLVLCADSSYYTLQYEKINDKYTLASTTVILNHAYERSQKKFCQYKTTRLQYLINFNDMDIESFPKERAIQPQKRAFSDIFTNDINDESFWEQYNYIPLEESIKAKIQIKKPIRPHL